MRVHKTTLTILHSQATKAEELLKEHAQDTLGPNSGYICKDLANAIKLIHKIKTTLGDQLR